MFSFFGIFHIDPIQSGIKDARNGKTNPPIRNRFIDFRSDFQIDKDNKEYYESYFEESAWMRYYNIVCKDPTQEGIKDAKNGCVEKPPTRNHRIDLRSDTQINKDVKEYRDGYRSAKAWIDIMYPKLDG